MDTRTKIVAYNSLPALFGDGRWLAVAGYFDPLTVAQTRRLASVKDGDRLLAVVVDREDAFLPPEARAALVASLREVDAVTIVPSEQEPDLSAYRHVRIIADLEDDGRRSHEFARFVLQRQEAK